MTVLNSSYQVEELLALFNSGSFIALSKSQRNRVLDSFRYLEQKLEEGGTHYGINTGFGAFHNILISGEKLQELQENLVRSHACGTGPVVSGEISRLCLLLKIINLSKGHSGVSDELVDGLISYYNSGAEPVLYRYGSLGASGDLAPLAHLSLPLLGDGEVVMEGRVISGKEFLQKTGRAPYRLKPKEGLALLNGTQFSTAIALIAYQKAAACFKVANQCLAASLLAWNGRTDAFSAGLHALRPYRGARDSAEETIQMLDGSGLDERDGKRVQDPYSFRCAAQVHGASKDVFESAQSFIETEVNSVTDNPLLLQNEDKIISGGHFHAQPIAMAADMMKIGASELGSISERRSFQLLSGKQGLPPFLAQNPGLNSGLMIAQYTAASMASANKQLASPSSIDSIVSSNGQEDHVSMAPNAGMQLLELLENVERILSIEWLIAAQALEYRDRKYSDCAVISRLKDYKKLVGHKIEDRVLSKELSIAHSFLFAQ